MSGFVLVALTLAGECGSVHREPGSVAAPELARATLECDPDDTSDVVVWAEPAAPTFEIGEPLWISIHVANVV